MLLIIMHNRRDYLQALIQQATKQAVTETTIIEKDGIGSHLLGDSINYIFHKGDISSAYNKAFVAVLENEQAKHLLDSIENDDFLNLLNLGDKGFICSVPFQKIRNLVLEASCVKEERVPIRIGNFLTESQISLNITANNKKDLIKEMAASLKSAKEITDFEVFLADILEREKIAPTGIGNEIAIPHARSEAVKDFVIAVGISREGVKFNSLDGKPAKLIFLIGTPKSARGTLNTYLNKLSHLSRLLQKEAFKNSLLEASRPEEVVELFQNTEAGLKTPIGLDEIIKI